MMKVKVIERSTVSPLTPTPTSLPLTFFDLPWLCFPSVQRLFFYHTTTTNTKTLIPNLKRSLSLALRHFYPFAGNLINWPDNATKPEILCSNADSISFTVAESADSNTSTNLFDKLISTHYNLPIEASAFQTLVPSLVSSSLMAVQVTLFPNSGFSVGVTVSHVVADGRISTHFIKCWASICRLIEEGDVHDSNQIIGRDQSVVELPFYDRSVIKDPNGIEEAYLNDLRKFNITSQESLQGSSAPEDIEVRATFVLSQADIERLRKRVLLLKKINNNNEFLHLSTFVLACAYIWVCLIKSRKDEANLSDTDTEYFVFSVDCRDRLDPPIPKLYFGNCLIACVASASRADLVGDEDQLGGGIAIAAKEIGKEVQRMNTHRVMEGAEKLLANMPALMASGRVVSVAGSPKFKVYETDFGWGRPKKVEVVSIDGSAGAFSLSDCRDYEEEKGGAMEIGMVLSKVQMDAFASLYAETLKALA